ncbi:MAG: hypothetical protein ABIT76_08715 [Chthoniobacterales bacterium]
MDTPAAQTAQAPNASLAWQFATSFLRHAFTLVAGSLIAHGWLAASKADEFADLFSGIALTLAILLWSWLEKKFAKIDAAKAASQIAPLIVLALVLTSFTGCASNSPRFVGGVSGTYRGVDYSAGYDGKTVTTLVHLPSRFGK